MVKRWWALGAALVAVTSLAAGCGGEGESGSPSPPTEETTTTTTAPTTSTVLSDEDAVLTAYEGYWDTILSLGGLVPGTTPLSDYATGAALERSGAALANQREVGQYVALPEGALYRHEATVESIAADIAIVTDCSVDDGLLMAYGSDAVLDDSVTTRRLQGHLVREAGTWLVEDVRTVEEWPGVGGCAG